MSLKKFGTEREVLRREGSEQKQAALNSPRAERSQNEPQSLEGGGFGEARKVFKRIGTGLKA